MASFAFIPPSYFAGMAGGAQTLMAQLAKKLAARGDRVEIWTTCAKDARTWSNDFAPSRFVEDGVTIERFLVNDRNLEAWIPRQISISEGMHLGIDEELLWCDDSVHSDDLYRKIALDGASFDALIFGPYLFGTTLYGIHIHPERSLMVPCLHDEAMAYTEIVRAAFLGCRGALFNAPGEQDLARAIYGEVPGSPVGIGFDNLTQSAMVPRLPQVGSVPYVLYLGRKETLKNVPLLIDYFIEGKERQLIDQQVNLVIAGGGSFDDLHRPAAKTRTDVIDIGYLSEQEKLQLLQHSLCLVQPSTNESFGIVQMEGWLQGVPALVHGRSPVTKQHVTASGGGLYFVDAGEFAGCVQWFLDHPVERAAMVKGGARYVAEQYCWPAVLARFDRALQVIGIEVESRQVSP